MDKQPADVDRYSTRVELLAIPVVAVIFGIGALVMFAAVEGPVTPDVPASILKRHPQVSLYLDEPAASLLSVSTVTSVNHGAPYVGRPHLIDGQASARNGRESTNAR